MTEKSNETSAKRPSRSNKDISSNDKSIPNPQQARKESRKPRSSDPKVKRRAGGREANQIARDRVEPTVKYVSELKGKRKIIGLTAYDAILGSAVSQAGVDFILVGDSLGTTLLGHATTINVTLEDMIRHTAAVRRSNPKCLLVADLPFGEASFSFDRLLESSRRLMQEGGADAVKIEGGRDIAEDVEKLVATGIPVLGHIGLLPQTVKAIGGYRKFGDSREEAEALYTDAITLEDAGCFAIIAEMVVDTVAANLSKQILPPLIGIGSGQDCDGQILVTTDLLGWSFGSIPKFVKPYANLNKVVADALSRYVNDLTS